MNINVTKPTGVICKTQGKYCAEDITVVPVLEEKSATPTESAQEIVPSSGNCGISKVNIGAVQTETKTITPTTSQQTFTPTSGKYFKQVICQAIPSDYIIPSGTLQITDNGTKDVTNYKNVNVNVEPNLEQKTVTITENGTTEVTPTTGKDGMSKVTVTTNVPTSGGVEEVATAAAMDALLVEANVGKYYKFTGTTDSNYTNGDLYLVERGAVTQDELAGTWVFNEQLNTTELATTYVNFTSNGKTCSSIQRNYSARPFAINDMFYNFDGADQNVYDLNIWVDNGYKTITITSKLSEVTNGDTLLTWLQANATKQ